MRDSHPYDGVGELPRTVPVFPLDNALLLPGGRLPLNIFEPRYLTMVDDALAHHRLIGMIQPRDANSPAPKPEVYTTGCVGRITTFSEQANGRYGITLTGICRFEAVEELNTVTPYRQFTVDFSGFAGDLGPSSDEHMIDREALTTNLKAYLEKFELQADWDTINQAPLEALVNSLSMICPFASREKQALLEAQGLGERAETLISLLRIATASGGGELPLQ